MGDEPKAVPILTGKSDSDNVMRGRDVRATLDKRNLDPVLINVIATIAEVAHVNMKSLLQMATTQDQMLDIVQGFADIAGNMKDKMEKLEKGEDGAENSRH